MKRIALLAPLLLLTAFDGSGPKPSARDRAEHVLNRLAFGARPGEAEKLVRDGIDAWIERQLRPETIDDGAVEAKLEKYATLKMSNGELFTTYYKPVLEARRKRANDSSEEGEARRPSPNRRPRVVIEELASQKILRAVESERQLHEVMVDFWMNHFNVFAGKGLDRVLVTGYERDVIRPNVWGNFETLLMATAKSPAMLFYLDNARSVAAPEQRPAARHGGDMPRAGGNRRQAGLNENYAREIMELHTLGVDGGYTQKDVTELARVLTGWSISRPEQGGSFVFRRRLHDAGEKSVLGVRFRAGGGIEEGETMIRFLASHPSTARHIARKLCQRLVADDPPKALVDRVAKRFLETRGDLRETVRAVVTSREFNDPKFFGAKVKKPFEYVVSAVRAAGGTVDDPRPIARELQRLGEPLYLAQPPTGYSDASEAWINSGALVNRLNFAVALAEGKMPGVRVPETAREIGATLGSPAFQKQ